MKRNYLPGTQIEIINEVERGRLKHALFDFDGTISLLREGWQNIMAPVMIEMICGKTTPTQDIIDEVHRVIDETTGIQTIFQMQKLVEMVRAHGLVPEEEILDPYGYKDIYNERLMVPVNERIAQLESGAMTVEQATLRGALDFVRMLRDKGVRLYVFSGTDREDVRNEAAKVGAAPYFDEIWGAVRSIEEYSKEKVLKEIIAAHQLHGTEVMTVGDGPVEIRNGKENGCIAIGVASNEVAGHGWDEHKRERLIRAGADILIPDFAEGSALLNYLFPTS
ncbi:MAG TPA: HAD hydrolase-like protein [Candidatus Hydrogenedentes bacterium]|nr:HAD hydrolase-like protein [Candidatus Hydrogenedentota bacterium]HOV72916.1 HAD hydrolase-like protein [Candidatus Hydrogenedentota bacterium]HPC15764.1 HAD hydrolase-like protein [Candidatus Hydrogenedentota bacterium]HRT19828.1 HAD hydrolase-like protein [Candidatus Hydrogenedentota bacterium]HRT64601.1 HAD hydrolase-like protein [Candidatus Hydrogenedentota bacterium]